MRSTLGVLCIACLTACGDDMTDSLTGGMTGSTTTTVDPVTTEPTSGINGSGEETAADGSADGTAETGTNTEPTTGPTGTGSTDATSTTDTTGAPAMCDPMPAFDPEMVPIDESCKVELQEGTFNPVIEWKHGSTSFAGPAAVGQIVDTDASGVLDDLDMPIILIYQDWNVVALRGDGSGVAWQANGPYGDAPLLGARLAVEGAQASRPGGEHLLGPAVFWLWTMRKPLYTTSVPDARVRLAERERRQAELSTGAEGTAQRASRGERRL